MPEMFSGGYASAMELSLIRVFDKFSLPYVATQGAESRFLPHTLAAQGSIVALSLLVALFL